MIKELLKLPELPIFGICLGHQMLALALGAKTIKMNHGHHGANHPVKDLTTGKVEITAMNHGFAVDSQSLPNNVKETHVSFLMDQIAGLNLLADQFTQFSITQRQVQALWIVSIYLKDLQQILMRKNNGCVVFLSQACFIHL